MKLTKENIQFIDNYFSNSDVKHLDIRLEMIDHVATAIETEMQNGDDRDFYYIFKDYMVENKTKLLDENFAFIKQTTKRLGLQLLKNLYKPVCILTIVLAFFTLKLLHIKFGFEIVKNWSSGIILTLFIVGVLLYFYKTKRLEIKRISAVERSGFLFTMLFNVFNLVWNISGFIKNDIYKTVIFIMISFILGLFVSMLILSFQIISESKEKYKMLS